MSKRFTDTEKWKKKWIKQLEMKYKLFWVYVLDSCNNAGIWDVELDIANMRLNTQFNEKELLKTFRGRIISLHRGNKWFIPKFIEFQYVKLNPDNRFHNSVINLLKSEGVYKGLISPSGGVKEKEKDKYKEKVKVKEKEEEVKNKYLDFIYMTELEYNNIIKFFGKTMAIDLIQRLNDYLGSKGKKYKSHYFTILNWARRDNIRKITPPEEKTFKPEEYTPPNEEELEKVRKLIKGIGK